MKGTVSDRLNFAKKITPQRFINGIKLYSSYYYSKWLNKNAHWGMPVSISVEPTTSCNLRCPECPSGLRSFTRPTGMMDFDLLKKTIDEQYHHLLYLLLYFQGEPFLNPRLFDFVKYAVNKKIYTATSTNGHYLDQENAQKIVECGLDRLIISVDGTTQSTYEKYRIGGKLNKVIEGAENVVKWKKRLKSPKPHLIFQFLVVNHNEHQVNYIYQLAKDIGINEVKLKTAQIYDYQSGSDLLPSNNRFSRYYKGNDGTYEIKNKLENRCWKMWHSNVVTWDGQVVPCCFDKDADHQLGNLNDTQMTEIWKNKKYRNFRRNVNNSRKDIDMCTNCTEGMQIFS